MEMVSDTFEAQSEQMLAETVKQGAHFCSTLVQRVGESLRGERGRLSACLGD
jgi:hypothetical protein